MYIKMLEAVSNMMADSKEIKVQCALTMLNKIIEGMRGDEQPIFVPKNMEVITPTFPTVQANAKVPTGRPHPTEPTIEVEEGKIVRVHNAKADTIIELDGKKYSATEVVGKSFTKGRIL